MADQIRTVSDMVKAIQDEIDNLKTGALPADTARTVFRGRALQLKAAELNLQYQRINRQAQKPKEPRELNLLNGNMEPIAPTPVEEAKTQ
jgi:hypothetical protein